MPSVDIPAGNELLLDVYLGGLFAAAAAASVGNPPVSVALISAGLGLAAMNLGDPIAINNLASHWRNDLGGPKIGQTMKDLGESILDAYTSTVGGAWTGDAQAKFSGYLKRLDNIGWQFNETGDSIKGALQSFALAVLIADLAVITVVWASAGIMGALLPGMVPVGETAPAISAVAVQLIIALVAFVAQMGILAATGMVQVGNIDYEIGLLTKKIWAEGQRDVADVTRNNNAIIQVPPVRDWSHDPSLDK
jgi:hypothetical protein